MGSAEIRVGPIGLLGDVSHVPVETNITTRNVFFRGGQAALRTNTGTALVLYRLVDAPNQFADLGVGFRSWGFGINVSAGSASARIPTGHGHHRLRPQLLDQPSHRLSQSQLQLFDRGRQFGFQRSYEGADLRGDFPILRIYETTNR
jgi:hypothetical protein